MKRDIFAILKLSNNQTSMIIIEKSKTNYFPLFESNSQTNNVDQLEKFFAKTLNEAQAFLKCKLDKIFVQIDDSKELNIKINLVEHSFPGAVEKLSKKDLQNYLINLQQKNNATQEVIFSQHYQYFAKDLENKWHYFSNPPLNKKDLHNLHLSSAKIEINQEIVIALKKIFAKFNCQIVQILPTSAIIPYTIEDSMSSKKEFVNFHLDDNFAIVSLVQNNVLLKYQFTEFNINILIDKIATRFKINQSIIRKILVAKYNDLDLVQSDSEIINSLVLSTSSLRYKDIIQLSKIFFNEIHLEIQKFLLKANLSKSTPILITGKINDLINFDKFVKQIFQTHIIYSYKNEFPDLLQQSNQIKEAIGYIKCINYLDEIIDYKNYNTIIETQPIKISHLLPNKKNLFSYILNIFTRKTLGEKHA
ncbi:hypothetical protein NV226_01515 [Mycoplasma iguanae]|uniref:Cell division protein FtsA n=1 Tax=Mycoplasma iguanae TaxID=292461 RepID=A0ABY5R8X8_9MOLU|nr:hypothetical protein [Mycoplasma iguanae]UVD81966.1 hypothetical protein NV226_01515 [Mycoplasma iguanae]